MASKDYKVGIYARLSNEDKRMGESVSIENQVLMLTDHVKEQGWELVDIYQDDGFSGTNQKRPDLQRMLADIRHRRINCVLIKDLSRIGRNYLEVGNLSEVLFPEYDCELISLSEKMDDMAVIRNYFNEIYSKDTSKKVRAVKRMCAQNGKYMGTYAPYGYCRDPEDKHRFVIDENTAPIVRRIFDLRIQGNGYKSIAQILNESGIIPPRDYYYQQKKSENPLRQNHCWCIATVRSLLQNEVYIGNVVQCKVGTVSYKNNKCVAKPKEEWIRTEGVHEPIIDSETWELALKIGEKKYQPRKQKEGKASIFSGILVCADCNFKMRSYSKRRTRQDGSKYHYSGFQCGNYARSGKAACTIHTIGEGILHNLVAGQIRAHARMVDCDEKRIVGNILRSRNSESEATKKVYLGELKAHQNRLSMLGRLVEKLYEDRLNGAIPETVFRNLIQKYEAERLERQQSSSSLEQRIHSIQQDTSGTEKWAKLIRQYTTLEVLDAQILLTLVDRIEIGDVVVTADGRHTRDIRIVYNYVGDVGGMNLSAHIIPEGTVSVYEQAV